MGKKGLAAIAAVLLILLLGYLGFDFSNLSNNPGSSDIGFEDEPIAAVDGSDQFTTDGFSVSPVNDGTTESAEFYNIFFTRPTCPPSDSRFGSIDDLIAQDIGNATYAIDVAAFDLDLLPVIDALIEAEDNGIEVRVVTDDEHNPESTTNRLRRNGISVVEDKRSGLMHNKFIVIDDRFVWVGSMNFAETGVYCNDNNVVRFDSPDLAFNYVDEFNEMFDDRSFGPTSPQNTLPDLTLGEIDIENHFGPDIELGPVLAREIARADDEVLFMAFSFTSEDIGEAMIERAEAGLEVRGVFENVGSDAAASYYNDFRRTRLDNLEVRKDGNPRIMHHKVVILDRDTTIFGSFNFSNAANNNNDENIIIVRDPVFATYFIEEFETVWLEAE